jgi:hypothetical protein
MTHASTARWIPTDERDADGTQRAGVGASRGRGTTHADWRRRPGLLLPGEVEASWQVVTFAPGMSRALILEYGREAVDALGYRDDEVVLFLRDLVDGSLQLRVRGWSADGVVRDEVLRELRRLWPEVVR